MSSKARRWYTATEIARACGVTQHAVRYWYHWGWLPGIRTGRKTPKHPQGYWVRFSAADVELVLQRRRKAS